MLFCSPTNRATEDFSSMAPISHRRTCHVRQSPLARHESLPNRRTRSVDPREKGGRAMLTKLSLGGRAFGAPPPSAHPRLIIA
jgi:hypothetical protein